MNKNETVKLDILIKLSQLNNFNINQSLKISTYLPLSQKIEYANQIVDSVVNKQGNYDSINKYYQFTMGVFHAYTNLELNDTYEEYDKLVSTGLLNIIFTAIGDDYFDFKDFTEMRFSDKLREIYQRGL